MSGHVPKFEGDAGNFTEVFTLARGGGKAGSGDSQVEEASSNSPVHSGRPGRNPPRRVSAASESGSTRSSQEGSIGGSGNGNNKPSPPVRGREARDPSSARGGVRGSHEKVAGAGRSGAPAPRNVHEDYAGASHLPKFGEWNAGEGETNYTVMFTAASKERKTGAAVDDAPMKSSGDSYSNSSRLPKKQSSCWPCF